ncbi:MAG: hypothetical protein ACRDCE_17335 [Cetobacterium sp.]|uniref:hypothetical protein n=1 Tax=Cetobacterium sp. TaxID=2071632 RepID=UPI003EE7A2AB
MNTTKLHIKSLQVKSRPVEIGDTYHYSGVEMSIIYVYPDRRTILSTSFAGTIFHRLTTESENDGFHLRVLDSNMQPKVAPSRPSVVGDLKRHSTGALFIKHSEMVTRPVEVGDILTGKTSGNPYEVQFIGNDGSIVAWDGEDTSVFRETTSAFSNAFINP